MPRNNISAHSSTQEHTWKSRVRSKETKVRYVKSAHPYVTTQTTEMTHRELQAVFSVDIDIDGIIKEAIERARFTKGGKSRLLGGLVVAKRGPVKVLSTRVEEIPISKGYERVEEGGAS